MKLAHAVDKKQLDVLLCSRVFNEGVDIPGLQSAINASGYRATIPTVQKPGRGLRVAEGKTQFTFIDFVDRQHELLLEHSRARAKVYKAKSFKIHVVSNLENLPKLVPTRIKNRHKK